MWFDHFHLEFFENAESKRKQKVTPQINLIQSKVFCCGQLREKVVNHLIRSKPNLAEASNVRCLIFCLQCSRTGNLSSCCYNVSIIIITNPASLYGYKSGQVYPIYLSNPRDFDFFSLVKLAKDERCVFFIILQTKFLLTQ